MAGQLLNVLPLRTYSWGNVLSSNWEVPVIQQLEISQFNSAQLIVRWHDLVLSSGGAFVKVSLFGDGWVPEALGLDFAITVEFMSVKVFAPGAGTLAIGPTLSVVGGPIRGPAATVVINLHAGTSSVAKATLSVDLCLKNSDDSVT